MTTGVPVPTWLRLREPGTPEDTKLGMSGQQRGFNDLSEGEKQQLVQRMQSEAQQATYSDILVAAKKKCFPLCIDRPGKEFSAKEQRCLAQCTDRFLEARLLVGSAVVRRLQQDQQRRQQQM